MSEELKNMLEMQHDVYRIQWHLIEICREFKVFGTSWF